MLQRLRQLSPNERKDLWPAFWRLAWVRFCLLTCEIRTTLQRCGGLSQDLESTLSPDELALWRRRALAFRRVARLVPQARCLARSLALRWWMRSLGKHAELKIGVRKTDGKLHSHSWIVVNGIPIDETPAIIARHTVVQTEASASQPFPDTP